MAEIGTITTLFLTAAGLRLQAKVQAGRTPLILTRVKIGYGYLQDDMDLKSLTGPINEVPSHQTGEEGTTATVDLTRVYDDTQEGMAYVGITVKNGDNPHFYLREFGIYAQDPDIGEICYGIANLGDEAPPIAPYDGRNHIEYKYDFPTVIANADDVVANITLAADTPWDEYMSHKTNTDNPHNVTVEQIGAIPMSEKGSAGGVAELDASGTVPSSQLPSYVDDVIECNGISAFPTTGESGKIYVDTVTNLSYRWSGSQYTEISKSLALGETESTAYRGDRGAEAYRHSQQPHAPTTAATQTAMGLMSAADKKKLDGVESGAQTHRAPTSAEITSALGYTPANIKHAHNVNDITSYFTLSGSLAVVSAYGYTELYHDAFVGWIDGESRLISEVQTTFGAATFGKSVGEPNGGFGNSTRVYVRLYVKDGEVFWDEYYNSLPSDVSADEVTDIGSFTVTNIPYADGCITVDYSGDPQYDEDLTLAGAIIKLAYEIHKLNARRTS